MANPPAVPVKIMFSAGEPSGDLHAASVYRQLKTRLPDVLAFGMGGPHMQEAGIDVRVDSTSIAVMGLSEVLAQYFRIRRILHQMQAMVIREKPDLLICVDYKEFNLRLAQKAKAAGIKVLFYVSPQVWAWRRGRVKTYGKAIDAMAVLFPFEVPYYEAESVPCRYVGHPLVDTVRAESADNEAARLSLAVAGDCQVIGLLPGSRPAEVSRLLPVMLQAARRIYREQPNVQFLLIKARSVDDSQLAEALADEALPLQVIRERSHDAILACDAVMTSSGTATLEMALLQVPMAIIYKLSFWNYWIARALVQVRFIGLPNIIAGRSVVREFIQHEATAKNLSEEILRILADAEYAKKMKQSLAEVSRELGEGGGAANLADMALDILRGKVI